MIRNRSFTPGEKPRYILPSYGGFMVQIKNNIRKISDFFTAAGETFPLTTILILLFSTALSVFIDQSDPTCQWIENNGIPFLLLWGIGSYFAETWLRNKRGLKWIGAVCAALAAGVFVYGSNHGTEILRENVSHWQAAYGIVMISLGIYGNFKRSGLAFNQWCIRVVHELSRLAIICAVTAMGIALVTAIFVTLILNGKHYMLIIRAEFLILGPLFGTGVLRAQIRKERDLPNFFVLIVKYLLNILLITAFAVIYGYILKILITRVVPSNEIFRILAGLFIIGLPIWTLAGTFPEDHWLIRTGVRLPYVFIPFLFLQGYAIRERILAYGMTPLRYACLALMVFEVVYMVVYEVRKRETAVMLPFIACVSIVMFVLPGINMFSVSNQSQKAVFDQLISPEFRTLTSEEQSRLAGAYYYLAGNAHGQAMLSETEPAKIEAIKDSGKIGIPEIDQGLFIDYDFPVRNADIRDFDSMSMLMTYDYQTSAEKPEVYDPRNVVFYDSDGESRLTADISIFLNRCISAYSAAPLKPPDFSGEIQLDDSSMLRIWHCSMSVDPEGQIVFLDLSAVLLERSGS